MEINKKWNDINEAWLKSGLSQKKFCQQNNISYFKFISKRSALTRSRLSSDIPPESTQKEKAHHQGAFIPIKMSDHSPITGDSLSVIEIQLPYGITLRIPVDGKIIAR